MKHIQASEGKWLYDGHTYTKEIYAPDNADLSIWAEVERTDLTFDEQAYHNGVEKLIRAKYSVADELAILRQRDSKVEEFNEYYKFVEQCKEQAKADAWVEPIAEPNEPVVE